MIKLTINNGILYLKKRFDKAPKNIPEIYKNCTDHIRNNLRLSQISILTFSQFYYKINRNQPEIDVEATYGLHPH